MVTLPLRGQGRGWGAIGSSGWRLAPEPPGVRLGIRTHAVLSASSARNRCSWEKGGRCSGSRLQHRSISSYRPRGQAGGRDRCTYIVGQVEEGEGRMFFSSLAGGPRPPPPGPALTWRPWSRKNSPAFSMTCSSVSCPKGWARHSISTSHRVTPKAHTSLAVVNFPWGWMRHQAADLPSPGHFPGLRPLPMELL